MDLITKMTDLYQYYAPNATDEFLGEGKAKHLLRAILKKQVTTDREAVRHIYGPESQPGDKKFLMLKKELEDRLVDQLLRAPAYRDKKTSPINKTLSTKLWCRKQLIISELLLTHHEYDFAEKILVKAGQQAKKRVFYHIQEECALLLRQVYARQGEARKLARQEAQIAKIQQINHRITRAIGWHEQLELQIRQNISLSAAIAIQATEKAEILAEWRNEEDHPFLAYHHYRIGAIGQVHASNVEEFQYFFQRQVALLKRFSFFRDRHHLTELFLDRLLLCQAQNNAISSVRYANRLFVESNVPSLLQLKVYNAVFTAYIRVGEYQRAGQVLLKAKQISRLSKAEQGQWYVKEAYLYYMLLAKRVNESIPQFTPRFADGFNPATFDQLTQPLAYDKRGYQVLVLIIKTVLLHHFGRIDSAYHARNLQIYYQRHLRDMVEQRTQLFFKLITQLAAGDSLKDKEVARVEPLYRALEQKPKGMPESQELVPYEVLWATLQ